MIAGQARINGKLYAGDDLMMEVPRMIISVVPIDQAAANAKLDLAESYFDAIPGDGPGCCLPGQRC